MMQCGVRGDEVQWTLMITTLRKGRFKVADRWPIPSTPLGILVEHQ
jgi:hypothetical protein